MNNWLKIEEDLQNQIYIDRAWRNTHGSSLKHVKYKRYYTEYSFRAILYDVDILDEYLHKNKILRLTAYT